MFGHFGKEMLIIETWPLGTASAGTCGCGHHRVEVFRGHLAGRGRGGGSAGAPALNRVSRVSIVIGPKAMPVCSNQ